MFSSLFRRKRHTRTTSFITCPEILGKDINKLDNFSFRQQFGACSRTNSCGRFLLEWRREIFSLMNHQARKKQPNFKISQILPLKSMGFQYGRSGKQRIGNNCFFCDHQIESLFRTHEHVFSDFVCIVRWRSQRRCKWNVDKYDITGRPVQFQWSFPATQRSRSKTRSKDSQDPQNRIDFRGRIIFMSTFYGIRTVTLNGVERQWANMYCTRNRGYRIREAVRVKSLVSLWTRKRKSMVSSCPHKPNGAWNYMVKNDTRTWRRFRDWRTTQNSRNLASSSCGLWPGTTGNIMEHGTGVRQEP